VIDYFVNELLNTGYLHNHARMWFAAWWVHEARLPWQCAAALFYRHLLDGDPASNTLSWRWVAGLQTPGKTSLARRSNLEKDLARRCPPRCRHTSRTAMESPGVA
jgi:deoxyribodipyrimidine photo-lyase